MAGRAVHAEGTGRRIDVGKGGIAISDYKSSQSLSI